LTEAHNNNNNNTDDGAPPPAGTYSCVVDEHPRFHLDALRWFACLTEVAGVAPTDLAVHVVGSAGSDALSYLEAQGVAVVPVDRFDPRSPHCNKISGALRLAEETTEGTVVLCDTDLAVLEDPRALEIPPHSIGSKPVDAPVPPLEVLREVFDVAGLGSPRVVDLPWGRGDQTATGNGNGGLYLVPGTLLATVSSAWAHWARWLLDRVELLGRFAVYVDQVAMALALHAESIDWVALDVRWNTPTHDPSRIPSDASEPAIIHYHQEVDQNGLLLLTSSPSINRGIATANKAIEQVWRRAQPARTYQRWRDGIEAADQRAELTNRWREIAAGLIGELAPSSVLEVGDLDQRITTGLPIRSYTGIDGTLASLKETEAQRPDGRFHHGSLNEHPTRAEVTICVGLTLRQPDAATYEKLVGLLCDSTTVALLISGWGTDTGGTDADHRVHEALPDTVRRVAPGAEVYPVSGGNPAAYVVVMAPEDRHPRDFSPATLDPLIARHPDPLALAILRLQARRTTGFYPDHAPRLWEYPVVARLITDGLPAGSRLVDVGAGVTPLAPYLTSLGFVVDTVDPSPNHRVWPPQPEWNEWDFLDYAAVGLAHRSWNCTLDELPTRPLFDGAYSVSVIEHVPAAGRRSLLADIAARVREGGLVVLTIDLVRGADDLWNRNLGVEVEDLATHGTLADVIRECTLVGMELVDQQVVRDWGDTAVDIGLLALRRTGAVAPEGWRARGRALLSTARRPRP
jgi:hypothetical protein